MSQYKVRTCELSKMVLEDTYIRIIIENGHNCAIATINCRLEDVGQEIISAIYAAEGRGSRDAKQQIRHALGFKEWAGDVTVER